MDRRKFNPGRGGFKLSKEKIEAKLNADNGLMRERLKILGHVALWNVLTKKRLTGKCVTKVTNALISVRNQWLIKGYEDSREQGKYGVYGNGFMLASHRRGELSKRLVASDYEEGQGDNKQELL